MPSPALGHTLGERLALGGIAWANLWFVTPFELVLQMAAPYLVERGLEPAFDAIGPAFVMRLLLELPEITPRYFRDLGEQPQMAEALWATIRELRMAGLGADDLRAEAFQSRDKHAELRAVVAAVERFLADSRVYREALERLDVCSVQRTDVVIELPGVVWALSSARSSTRCPACGSRRARGTSRASRGRGASLGRTAPEALAPAPAPASDAERLAFVMSRPRRGSSRTGHS